MRTTCRRSRRPRATRPIASNSRVASAISVVDPPSSRARRPRSRSIRGRDRSARVRHHVRAPVLEVLDAADLHRGVVDVDPVVGKHVCLVDDQRDREEVAIVQPVGRRHALPAAPADQRAHQLAHRHRRDEVARRLGPSFAVALDARTAAMRPSVCSIAVTRASELDRPPSSLIASGNASHIMPGPEPRILESSMSVLIALAAALRGTMALQIAVASDRPLIRCAAHCAPDLGARNAPDLLGVGLEEDLEQPPAEPVGDPVLEAVFGRVGTIAPPQVADEDRGRVDRPETGAGRCSGLSG